MPIFQRHFTFKHPLFRKAETDSGVRWDQSVYYLWWEFLRRHDGYRRTCEQGGRGKFAKLFADFGDVHAVDFKTWWVSGDRGARLFAEPAVPMTVATLTRDQLAQLLEAGWDQTSLLVVSVPLTLPKRFITRRLNEILRTHHKRKRGQRQLKESRALYPIARQFNPHNLPMALKVWDLKKQEPGIKLWEIAQRLEFSSKLDLDQLGKRGRAASEAIGKKNVMGVAARRKLAQAERIIDGVGRGVFPAL